MHEKIAVSREFLEAVADLRLPNKLNERLQTLMDLNNDGALDHNERAALEACVALSNPSPLFAPERCWPSDAAQPNPTRADLPL